MNLNKADESLLQLAAKHRESRTAERWLWMSFACVVVGGLAAGLSKPDAVEPWAFAVMTVGGFFTVVQYAIFRMRALSLIQKLQLSSSKTGE